MVGLWIRPLIRDLDLLTESALAFAADYRHPIRALEKTSSLTDLAATLDEMSSRIRNLIQSQKELTGGLSHELRTPLTRIKFALAVIGEIGKVPPPLAVHDVRFVGDPIVLVVASSRGR